MISRSMLWQFPQHVLAGLIYAANRTAISQNYVEQYRGKTIYRVSYSGWSVSLGNYIFMDSRSSDQTVKHEYGHSRQSEMLGPMYLILVGLPSITMNILTRAGVLAPENYYKRWPENWADRLGGITNRTNSHST